MYQGGFCFFFFLVSDSGDGGVYGYILSGEPRAQDPSGIQPDSCWATHWGLWESHFLSMCCQRKADLFLLVGITSYMMWVKSPSFPADSVSSSVSQISVRMGQEITGVLCKWCATVPKGTSVITILVSFDHDDQGP